jgi:hypothetical protein
MKPTELIAVFSACVLGVAVSHAAVIRLADGTVLEGQLAEPGDVTIKTSEGDRKVAFTLLPLELQKVYWPKITETKTTGAAALSGSVATGALTGEELSALANEVNLETWAQVAAIGSFRDKPEKRGSGGLVVTKGFNALDENWVSVYSPKDPVGQAGNWNEQVTRAKAFQERPQQFMQKRWLELFIKAGEAVARRDSSEFAMSVRELKRSHGSVAANGAGDVAKNFFTAK